MASHHPTNFIHSIWTCLDPALQDALALAYQHAVDDDADHIKTRYVFAAILRLRPALIAYFPDNTLPEPTPADIAASPVILQKSPNLSGCVYDTLNQLIRRATPERQLTLEDVFVDIAKHGTGSAVEKLRQHGITAGKIDEIARQLGWQVMAR
jgi:hypothetical protein